MEYVMVPVTGTLIWYYYICQREVWLIGHQITPDQSDSNISLGRYIHENSYDRERKELVIGHSKMDVFRVSNGELVVGEVKKSSKYSQSAPYATCFLSKVITRPSDYGHVGCSLFSEKKGLRLVP